MPISNPASLVSFNADAVRDVILDTLQGNLRSLVEFTRDGFSVLYVDDVTLEFYGDPADMEAHFERIHSYIDLDFTEMELFVEELFPPTNRVRFLATGFDLFTLVRLYIGDDGLFLALDPDEPIEPLVAAIEAVLNVDEGPE